MGGEKQEALGARPGDLAACALSPHFDPAHRHPCKKARATLRRMEAELYSSWLGKRTSGWLCIVPPHPSTLPEPKKIGRATKGLPLLASLLCPSGGR